MCDLVSVYVLMRLNEPLTFEQYIYIGRRSSKEQP